MHCWSTWIFFSLVGRGNKMLMSSQKSVPVPMLPCHLSWEWGGKSLPSIFRCDIIFLVEISVVIDPNYFQIKSEKHPYPSTFYNFCSFIFVISSCHSTHAIFLYTVNINLHKIKQNNWKINDHSSFVGRRWQVTSPNFSLWHNFPCRNFRCQTIFK